VYYLLSDVLFYLQDYFLQNISCYLMVRLLIRDVVTIDKRIMCIIKWEQILLRHTK